MDNDTPTYRGLTNQTVYVEGDLPLKLGVTITGSPMQFEHRLIGALLNRLGGHIVLDIAELERVDGIILDSKAGGIIFADVQNR
jgi:hypothetical protein